MNEHYNDNNNLIISHIADVDGISPIVLAKLYFNDIDYCLLEPSNLDELLTRLINDNSYLKYDTIFITDLPLRKNVLKLIDSNPKLKSKIKHFDHHVTEIESMKKYSFVNIVNDIDGHLECGTTLFYKYLEPTFKYKSTYLNEYLEAVRCYDTMGPLCGNKYGNDLTLLFNLIGIDAYINKIYNALKKKEYPLSEDDKNLLKVEYQNIEEYLNICDKNMLRIKLNNHNVGVSISELYRSSVGNNLAVRHPELDYILILNYSRNSFSLRTIKDDINVGLIAKSFTPDGGGHIKAAGMPLNKDTIFILDIINEQIKKLVK